MNKETVTLCLLFGGGLYIYTEKMVEILLSDRVIMTSSKDVLSKVNDEENFKNW